MKLELSLRRISMEEMRIPLDWARLEGWNPGRNDGACFHAADPQGFILGSIGGEPVGCISAVRYGRDFGFLGFYIVRPGFRGRGYGLKLWAAAMDHLHGRRLGLDGVLEQQANYRKSGFDLAYRNIRYEGRGTGHSDEAAVVRLREVPLAQVQACDDLMFGVARHAFLDRWLGQQGAETAAVLRDGKLAGYAVMRPCAIGYKIGPLFADTPEFASRLLDSLLGRAPVEAPVYFDPPEVNAAAVALAEARGMKRVFETARMYKGPAPNLPLERLFGVTSFELG